MTTNITQFSRVVIRPRTAVYVSAERTTLSSKGEEFDQTIETSVALYLVEDDLGRRLVRMDGGPTGREAFELTPGNVEALRTRSWVASRGVRGGVDRLVVPCRELGRALARFGVEVETAEAAA